MDTLIKSAKIRGLREARWQGMTKQCGRPHTMRNNTASVLLAAFQRALHVHDARNLSVFRRFQRWNYDVLTCEREALSEAVLIRVSIFYFNNTMCRVSVCAPVLST